MAFSRRVILGNGAASAIQVGAMTVGYFVFYRMMIGQLGTEQLGLWSIVSVGSTISQMGNLGIQGAVVRFVADAAGRADERRMSQVLSTSVLGLSLILAIVFLVIWPLFSWGLQFVVEGSVSLALGRTILPLVLLAGYVGGLAGVVQGAFDGLQLMRWTSGMKIIGMMVFVSSALVLLRFGLRGVALAAIIQQAALLGMAAIAIRRRVPLALEWDRRIFGEILRYGIGLQAISILTMMCDPVTKGLLARFGGLESTALYEIAARIVTQSRALIAGAVSALVPAVAAMGSDALGQMQVLYEEALAGCLLVGIPLLAAVSALAPILSEIMTGDVRIQLQVFVWILCGGWLLNTMSLPAYMMFVGVGQLRWNVASHAAQAIANVVLGMTLGILYGATGVVVGWAVALALGSVVQFVASFREGIARAESLLVKEATLLFGGCGLSVVLVLVTNRSLQGVSFGTRVVACVGLTFALMGWACARHSFAKRLFNRGRLELAKIRAGQP